MLLLLLWAVRASQQGWGKVAPQSQGGRARPTPLGGAGLFPMVLQQKVHRRVEGCAVIASPGRSAAPCPAAGPSATCPARPSKGRPLLKGSPVASASFLREQRYTPTPANIGIVADTWTVGAASPGSTTGQRECPQLSGASRAPVLPSHCHHGLRGGHHC